MRRASVCLVFLLLPLACGGKKGVSGTAPIISDLRCAPGVVTVNDWGGTVTMQTFFTLQDPDADVSTLRIKYGGSNHDFDLPDANGVQQGVVRGEFQLPTRTVGTLDYQIQVLDRGGNYSDSLPATLQVNQLPKIGSTSLQPSSAQAGSYGFTVTVNGSNMPWDAIVQWNGVPLYTTLISDSKVMAMVPAEDLRYPGTAMVKVVDNTGASLSSDPLTFTITPEVFGVEGVVPTWANAGGPGFTLMVRGAKFTGASQVCWNGEVRPTTFVSSSKLTAMIQASDIASIGQAAVTVTDPTGPKDGSIPVNFAITLPDAVAYQINPGHSGTVTFPSVALPATSTWSVTLDAPPSFALIAEGKVITTTMAASGKSAVMALDQATGARIWGNSLQAQSISAVYDNGLVFVNLGGLKGGMLQALDVATGEVKWSVVTGGGVDIEPPTAAGGIVYVPDGVEMLRAYDELTGAELWTYFGGGFSTPAVTSDGVYLTYTGCAIRLDPRTGASIWEDPYHVSGGGSPMPVVADGRLFAMDVTENYGEDEVLDVVNGGVVGTFHCQSVPAIGVETGFFLDGGTLHGINLETNAVLWSFAGDGTLIGSPIQVNGYVFIGTSTGTLYALDTETGRQVWSQTMPGGISPMGGPWGMLSGLSAGDGLLVVPAGNTLTAFTLCPN
jgi:outer membrane protein assembly factor BamB